MLEVNELYEALEYSKYGDDLCDHTFQFEDGKNIYGEKFNGINLSGLFSLLIKEAGRLCDGYASDMFYDLKGLYEDLHGENSVLCEQETYRNVVGIRDYGCDHEAFMLTRTNDDSFTYCYREILLITVTPDERYSGMRKLSCFRVSPSSVDSYLRRKRVCEV